MSSRSRSASVSSESSDSGQLFQAAKAAAARDSLQTQANVIPLAEQPQPVASTSKPPGEPILASGRKLPEDSFGQLPRPRLSKKAWKDSQDKSAGGKWFHMPAAPDKPSEELKREVKALKLGTAIDPKRFLRGEAKRDAGKLPEHFQMGHILPSDHPASTDRRGPGKAGKKRSFVEEVAQDQQVRDYAKRKFNEVQTKSSSGGKNYYKSKQRQKTGGKSSVKRK